MKRTLQVLFACGVVGASLQARAYVVPVIDPANIFQTTLVAANTLDNLREQVKQTNQAIQAYVQDAKHLVSIPMSYIEEVEGMYAQYNSLLNQAAGMKFTVQQSVSQFEELYSTGFGGNGSFMQRARAMLAQIRHAGRAATEMTAIFERLCAEQVTVKQLEQASLASPGVLAAQQSTNQLLGVIAGQNSSLQQMQATLGRVHMGAIMRQSVAEEQAQANVNLYLIAPEPMPWNLRLSNGFTLPR